MRQALYFRLRDDTVVEDHVLQSVVFRDLVHGRPGWLSCVSYECDPVRRALVLDVPDLSWIRGLPTLTHYLDHLDDRCAEPFVAEVDAVAGTDLDPTQEVGRWDPRDDRWCIPYGWWLGDGRPPGQGT
ncbi:hypothetical protein [Actinomycetospora termitidis]|uniref:DUF4262 domain-containing protein n=1 Tax=Actinomycetospora termitidis TaxID=3053470 RepID=A0ABT7MGM6_9PSEU|nr:hypothetical protein [Actinomycetospora sp. Odt1-22]MDL5159829.1 hypothetical protein [Actinomycetospora sp. Odt1-22]